MTNDDITLIAEHSGNIDANDADVTLRIDADAQPSRQRGTNVATFMLHGKSYTCVRSLSKGSGEAEVFLVRDDSREYVLKVYYPNVDIKKDTLRIVAGINFDMIVRLFDFGKIYLSGNKRYCELMEYLAGGSLAAYSIDGDFNKFRRIALQAAAALECCHHNNIIHKDIKPSNFFFRDAGQTEVVLGDFGISSVMTDGGYLHRTTQARTPLYAAPEMYNDVIDGEVEISPAADFYSLGIMLMTLWLGRNPLNTNERMIIKRKSEGRLPGVNELPDRVRLIVQGLTAVNPETRWTYDSVEKWFGGESPKVDITSPQLKYRSFVVDPDRNLVADNIQELIPLLLDNMQIACGYLYSGKISEWLELCGNTKLRVTVDDIVRNMYPADRKAGLMAAIYAMNPAFPYVDVHGNKCKTVKGIVTSMLNYPDEYISALRNRNDNLFIYLEAHSVCDVNRIRNYFADVSAADGRKALMRAVYEIDPDIPLFSKYPSSSMDEIIRCFGRTDITDDEWKALTDGRLLSWMYSHEGHMACESLRIMTDGQPHSRQLAYKVLYNIDRGAAYDMRKAYNAQQIGELLCDNLRQWQSLDDESFARCISEYSDPDGRFCCYARLRGWVELLSEAHRCFDLNSEENKERLGLYNLRTAAYRFCKILGVSPVYELSDGTMLSDGLNIDNRNRSQIRTEMRTGAFAEWLSVFYHENPENSFSEPYEYERALELWINKLGEFDAQNNYYKRFVKAKDETARKYEEVRKEYQKLKSKEAVWRMAFYGASVVLILLLVAFGIDDRQYMLEHSLFTIGIPVGGMSAVIVGARAFFRGYGFVLSCIWGVLGFCSSLIPAHVLRYTDSHWPAAFVPVTVLITIIYMMICRYTDFRSDTNEDSKLINDVLENDVKSALLEPLYYTFKTKAYRFKGSKFGIIDDVRNRIRSVADECVLHYQLWTVMAVTVLLEIIVFNIIPAL